MAPAINEEPHCFASVPGIERRRSLSIGSISEQWSGIALTSLYVGAAAQWIDIATSTVEIGISIHDGVYSVDFNVRRISPSPGESLPDALKRSAKESIKSFSEEHCAKFIGCGLTPSLAELCPDMGAFLWRELDMVVLLVDVKTSTSMHTFPGRNNTNSNALAPAPVDEQADSAARKLVLHFSPQNIPVLDIGFKNKVEVDLAGKIQLCSGLDEYQRTVSEQTWKVVKQLAGDLKKDGIKMAFFSATPQGGGVALMRHALIRFARLLGIQMQWYIPKPSPKVFRITKTNHNILQGVAAPNARLDKDAQAVFNEWIETNAAKYWFAPGGPLAEDGADVVFIDDPQMPGLIPLIKRVRPNVKIVYRSHIEIRSDLVHKEGSPQEEVWKYLWERIQGADVFISHPVSKFVPTDVPKEMVALMPACTDWLDGLNKSMAEWDLRYYHHLFRNHCTELHMPTLAYPARPYIIQVARFDPSKGIPDVLASYVELRRLWRANSQPESAAPQLLICGHGAIDDPDASIIYDETMGMIENAEFDDIREDIVVMRIGPSDQVLNALLSKAKLALQLSTREGFEVKVSEALHKGIPVIAARAGGIPLQVQHGKNGYLVENGDGEAAEVAKYAYSLLTEREKYKAMSEAAKTSVSDEVGTVGNAVCWMWLARALVKGDVKPRGRWVVDLAREELGVKWGEQETRLPREGIDVLAE